MIDHISFSVYDYQKSLNFYDETLKILGYDRLMSFDLGVQKVAGYGTNGRPQFWMGVGNPNQENESVGKAKGLHVAFVAPSIEAIEQWYKKCLELGGTDNGAPGGPRPEYHPGYYGAFIVDPNGWRIEACLHHYEG